MDLRLVTELADPASPSSLRLDVKRSDKRVARSSNFCSIDKLLGNTDKNDVKSNPSAVAGRSSPVVGVRMPSVLDLVSGLHQHHKAAAAAAALRGELGKQCRLGRRAKSCSLMCLPI